MHFIFSKVFDNTNLKKSKTSHFVHREGSVDHGDDAVRPVVYLAHSRADVARCHQGHRVLPDPEVSLAGRPQGLDGGGRPDFLFMWCRVRGPPGLRKLQ